MFQDLAMEPDSGANRSAMMVSVALFQYLRHLSMPKASLPTLNLSKVKQLNEDDATNPLSTRRSRGNGGQGTAISRRAAVPVTQTRRETTTASSSSSWQDMTRKGSNSQATTSKPGKPPVVPTLNLSKHEGLGFGTGGGIESSLTSRGPPASSSQAQRGSSTARATVSQASESPQARQASARRPSQRAGHDKESSEEGTWESGALTPNTALKRYSEYMTAFEHTEVQDFKEVFFVGRCGAPKIKGNPQNNKTNFGYDDERGDYNVVLHDHLAYRYEVLSIMGKGSFGQVLKCHDFRTNRLFAIKIIRNKKRFHHQALVELKVLKYLVREDPDDSHNVVHMHEHFTFRNHLCIAFELLSLNLYEFVKHNNFVGLSIPLIRRFGQQILSCLQFMKDLKIIHCDLKPENIMLRQPNRSLIKVIDFGSSCMTDERIYTYIQSRFYRAPEVILGLPYSTAIDMWSFACILAELYTGYPLFPGEDEAEQIQCIMEVFDLPPAHVLGHATRRKVFFDSDNNPRISANSQGRIRSPGTKTLSSVLRCTDAPFLDFLSKCLTWDPEERLTPEEAMNHPWAIGDPPPPQSKSPAPIKSPSPVPVLPAGFNQLKRQNSKDETTTSLISSSFSRGREAVTTSSSSAEGQTGSSGASGLGTKPIIPAASSLEGSFNASGPLASLALGSLATRVGSFTNMNPEGSERGKALQPTLMSPRTPAGSRPQQLASSNMEPQTSRLASQSHLQSLHHLQFSPIPGSPKSVNSSNTAAVANFLPPVNNQ